MIEIVWEIVVKAEARGLFELAYGPGGAWSTFFAGSPGFRGLTVLRDTHDPRRYLTIEVWDTETHRQQAVAAHQAAHAELEASLAVWVESRHELGVYRVVAEGAVRPRGKPARKRPGADHWDSR